MTSLVGHLEFARVYLDDLLCLTNGTFMDHIEKLEQVLQLLQEAGLKCNAEKCTFCSDQVEYLGYLLTRDGIRPLPKKVAAILSIKPPTNVREVRRFLGLVQYYRDLWEKRSHILVPLTTLVRECGATKAKKKNLRKFY